VIELPYSCTHNGRDDFDCGLPNEQGYKDRADRLGQEHFAELAKHIVAQYVTADCVISQAVYKAK